MQALIIDCFVAEVKFCMTPVTALAARRVFHGHELQFSDLTTSVRALTFVNIERYLTVWGHGPSVCSV